VWSEAIWLTALHRDTDLAVPEPVPTADGSMLTVAETEGVPTPRTCVLFRWGAGRFLDAGLTPRHLERVGGFIARLHDHALRFSPPAGFARWRIGEVSRGVTEYVAGLVRAQFGSHVALTVGSVLDTAHQAQRELGTGPEVFGLIHGDLHQENYLFDHGRVRAIDFDDSGWGHFTYDLAVVLSELRHREGYASLRAALLRGYRAVRPLSAEHERYLEIFYALRLLQLSVWCIEQRDHPGFAHWEEDARGGLAELGALQRTG
jgi:Ser/Thr protein kinase RdoA (MazF antagonist)